MPNFAERQDLISRIEAIRGRTLVCFLNFDRQCIPNLSTVLGLSTTFTAVDTKEALFRTLKESVPAGGGIDLFMYTRGGDTNGVWPLVSIIREFDTDFEVLVPFRCHSSGTLLALGARRIVLGPLSELSPIDPSTGNQFNPIDPAKPGARLSISVEDVQAYRTFLLRQLGDEDKPSTDKLGFFSTLLDRLVSQVHPLAIGNVHRVLQQITQLAGKLLELHPVEGRKVETVVEALTTRFFSHLHMINRHEAKEILSGDQVMFAGDDLAVALDVLLRAYEDNFSLRKAFVLSGFMEDEPQKDARFLGAAIESRRWGYLFETNAKVTQHTKLPPNVQVQLPAGQAMRLLPGLPREFNVEITSQGWMHNTKPHGFTV